MPEFSSFKLAAPPLQPGAVGPYPVRGTWFPNSLPLEGIGSYPDLLSRNQRSVVHEVQDTDTIIIC
jgi:hypothetical protein